MANKKINELDSRASLSLSDLMAVGDPSTGYLYKTTISDLKTLTGAGVISFNGRFGAVSPVEGDYTLTQLGDVIITSASNAQLLQFNGSNWVNWTPNYLTSYTETSTLDAVTTRGNTTANSITVGSVSAAGLSNLLGQIKTFATTGNTYIGASPGSATDAGYKLDVNGTARVSNDMTLWDDGANNGNSRALILRALGSTGNVQTGQIILDGFGAAGQDYMQLTASNIRLAPTSGTVTITGTTPSISTVAASGFRFTANSTTNGFIFTQAYNQTSGDIFAVFTNSNQKKLAVNFAGVLTVADLSGTGSRMVVADANGVMSTQAIPTSAVSSVFGRTGAVVAASGDYTTTQVTEGTNLYYTDARARAAISASTGISYNSTTGAISSTITQYTDALARAAVSLTTSGSSGAATYNSSTGVLNIPNYGSALSGYVPYTGATGSLNLGANDLESKFVFIEGDGSLGGILSFKQYSSSWQSTTDHTNIYATGTNKLNFSFFQTGGGGKFFNFDVSSLGSTGRTYTMPDASGTLALTSNIPTVAGVYLPLVGGVLTGKLAGVNLEFSNPSATFVSGGVNNSISSHIIAVPSGSTWSNGAAFSASNNTQMLSFGGSQSIQNGAIVAGTVNVNRISFTAGSATVTMAQSTGIRAMAGMQMLQQTGGTINGTVSHGASMMVQGVYPTNTANITFTNYYGVLINPLDEWGGVTFGSRYGIYQAGASDANFFAGYTTFGQGIQSMGMFTADETKYVVPGGVSSLTTLLVSGSVTANGVMSLGNDGTYGSTYKTLGLTGNSNGSHRIFAGTADNIYIAAATARGVEFWTNGVTSTRMVVTSGGSVLINRSSNPYESTYKFIVKNTTDQNIGFGLQEGELSIEAFNDAVNSPRPLRIYGSKISILGGDVSIKNGTITTGVAIAISAINTAYVLKAGAYSGLVVIRDNTNGGSGVWITDPNMGTILIANNMPGAFTIGWNGSNTMITKTSGNTINISVSFYSNILS